MFYIPSIGNWIESYTLKRNTQTAAISWWFNDTNFLNSLVLHTYCTITYQSVALLRFSREFLACDLQCENQGDEHETFAILFATSTKKSRKRIDDPWNDEKSGHVQFAPLVSLRFKNGGSLECYTRALTRGTQTNLFEINETWKVRARQCLQSDDRYNRSFSALFLPATYCIYKTAFPFPFDLTLRSTLRDMKKSRVFIELITIGVTWIHVVIRAEEG